jgi:hypothetical protein
MALLNGDMLQKVGRFLYFKNELLEYSVIIHIQSFEKKPSGFRDMITYIKTKKKVPINTCLKMLGIPYIHPYAFLHVQLYLTNH